LRILLVGIFFILLLAIFFVLFLILISPKPSREYGVQSVTLKGEDVRSYKEKIIADYFTRHNISYIYEPKVITKNRLINFSIGYSDFYLPDYDVYVEFWGLVTSKDEITKNRYIRRMKQKMAQYYANDIKFISIYPDNLKNFENFDWIFRRKFKQVTGFELPN